MFAVWAIDKDGVDRLANTYDSFGPALRTARDLSRSGLFEAYIENIADGRRIIRFPAAERR